MNNLQPLKDELHAAQRRVAVAKLDYQPGDFDALDAIVDLEGYGVGLNLALYYCESFASPVCKIEADIKELKEARPESDMQRAHNAGRLRGLRVGLSVLQPVKELEY